MINKIDNKKICFVTTLSVTLVTFLRPQTIYLLENGWDVTWVCADNPDLSNELPDGVRYKPLPFRRGMDILGVPKLVFSLFKLFKEEKFNIVQYSTPNAAFCSSIAACLADVPVRLYAQWGIRYVGFEGIARKIFKYVEILCCKLSTIVEPDSLSNLEFSVNEGLYPKNKGRVIGCGSASGVNLTRFDISRKKDWRTEYRRKLGLTEHNLVIGFVGSIRRDKGCNELIRACRSFFDGIPEARLMLVGDKSFYSTIDNDLCDWISSSAKIIHIPPTSEVPQYLACMDIFSLPSYREGFGSVIIEAEAMGLPVVVSNVPGPVDAMIHKQTGIAVPVKDKDALAFELEKLIKDKEKRLVYGKAALGFARKNFDQERFLQLVFKDKEELVKKKNN